MVINRPELELKWRKRSGSISGNGKTEKQPVFLAVTDGHFIDRRSYGVDKRTTDPDEAMQGFGKIR